MESTVLVGETPGCTPQQPQGGGGGGPAAVLVNAARLSFVDEAVVPAANAPQHRGYDVIPVASSHGTISVRQQEVEPSVHNKQHIELVHCGKSSPQTSLFVFSRRKKISIPINKCFYKNMVENFTKFLKVLL